MSRALPLFVLASVLAAGCASRAARQAEAVAVAAEPEPLPRALTSEEEQLTQHFLPGCAPHASSTQEELILYCPEQAVFFAVRDLADDVAPDRVFSEWLEELQTRTGSEVEVLERSESKFFGPQAVALYLKLRTADMPAEGFVEGYVARTTFNGKWKRVWCSASGAEPTGLARCSADLMSMAVITSAK